MKINFWDDSETKQNEKVRKGFWKKINIQRDRQRNGEFIRKTDRQTKIKTKIRARKRRIDRQTEIEREREREREKENMPNMSQ